MDTYKFDIMDLLVRIRAISGKGYSLLAFHDKYILTVGRDVAHEANIRLYVASADGLTDVMLTADEYEDVVTHCAPFFFDRDDCQYG